MFLVITLITGVPGSSKTLNTINEILTNDTYQNRPVYYYNIPEVKLDDWQELTEDEAKQWFQLPHGSVVILDECQRIFRPMKYGDKVPAYVEQLETHRHLGIDLFVITQHPKLIDTKVRRLVGRHLHFKRQFGMEWATRIEFQKCADDPDDYFQQKEAIKKRVKFPKKLYGVYKSSEEHTHKKKIPAKLYGVGIAIIVAIFLMYQAVAGFGQKPETEQETQQMETGGSTGGLLKTARVKETEPVLTWQEKRIPRVKNIPWSAPLYDDVYEVKAFPRPQCIQRKVNNVCNCYTQQATPLDISQRECQKIVANGYWDPTKKDLARSAEGSGGNSEASAETGATSPHQRTMEALRLRAEIAELIMR